VSRRIAPRHQILGARLRRKVGRDTQGTAAPKDLDLLGLGMKVGDDRTLLVDHTPGQVKADTPACTGDQNGIGNRFGRAHRLLPDGSDQQRR
jgi:hypothetical protein